MIKYNKYYKGFLMLNFNCQYLKGFGWDGLEIFHAYVNGKYKLI